MAQQFLEQLPRVNLPKGADECIICKEKYGTVPSDNGIIEHAVLLPCSHHVGSECIAIWLSPNDGPGNSCPLCRVTFFEAHRRDESDDDDDDDYSDEDEDTDEDGSDEEDGTEGRGDEAMEDGHDEEKQEKDDHSGDGSANPTTAPVAIADMIQHAQESPEGPFTVTLVDSTNPLQPIESRQFTFPVSRAVWETSRSLAQSLQRPRSRAQHEAEFDIWTRALENAIREAEA